MELCDSESFAKKSHPQNVIGDQYPFEFGHQGKSIEIFDPQSIFPPCLIYEGNNGSTE